MSAMTIACETNCLDIALAVSSARSKTSSRKSTRAFDSDLAKLRSESYTGTRRIRTPLSQGQRRTGVVCARARKKHRTISSKVERRSLLKERNTRGATPTLELGSGHSRISKWRIRNGTIFDEGN